MRKHVLVLVWVLWVSPVFGGEYENFFGEFAGKATTVGELELSARDMRVAISARDGGFNISWIAVIRKADGRVKRTEYSIDFQPSQRENIYRSAMRRNMFGQASPLDPMKGDPYVWAVIEGDELKVHALHITDTGGYEMQVYTRRITDTGMAIEYSRVRNGEILRTVTGDLKRIR